MIECLVKAKDIAKDFPDGTSCVNTVVQPSSCRIGCGDRIALTGPSGSGKSTLLYLMGGLDIPTRGTVIWPALGAREALIPRKITHVFQSQSLFPALTVAENVALPFVVSGKHDFADQRSMALLAEFELEGLADKLPDELSGGQAQRVALARALVTQPLLILADEPTGQLDAATARSLIDVLLRCIDGTSTALLIATHDLKIAERMETQWSMRHGVLVTDNRRPFELVAAK